MIGKVPKQGRGFRGLVNYLLHGKKGERSTPRVAWTATRNLLISDAAKVPKMMRMTAAKSRRVKKPVYHYIVSWHHDENPTDEMMLQVADTTCADLGLQDHQALYIAHQDTEHAHVHIVVNRVHPETGTAWKTSHDYRRIELSLARQAEVMGLEIVPGRYNAPEQFKGRPKRARNTEMQMNRRQGGNQSRPRWDSEIIAERRDFLQHQFDTAQSWEALHDTLAEQGIWLERKGQGVIIADDAGTMKLSQLGKDIRLTGLEQKFGQSFQDALAAWDARSKERTRDADWQTLRKAREATDLSFSFYRAGLTTRAQLDASLAERKRAEEAVNDHKPLVEQLTQDVGDALGQKPSAPQPPLPEREIPRPSRRKKKRDRGRAR